MNRRPQFFPTFRSSPPGRFDNSLFAYFSMSFGVRGSPQSEEMTTSSTILFSSAGVSNCCSALRSRSKPPSLLFRLLLLRSINCHCIQEGSIFLLMPDAPFKVVRLGSADHVRLRTVWGSRGVGMWMSRRVTLGVLSLKFCSSTNKKCTNQLHSKSRL